MAKYLHFSKISFGSSTIRATPAVAAWNYKVYFREFLSKLIV